MYPRYYAKHQTTLHDGETSQKIGFSRTHHHGHLSGFRSLDPVRHRMEGSTDPSRAGIFDSWFSVWFLYLFTYEQDYLERRG